jgi:hypothetical protein
VPPDGSLADGLFERDGDCFVATEYARGPWDRNALHGGPVAALCATAVHEHLDATSPPFLARLTVELFRPVPLGVLSVRTVTRRPGRTVTWIDVTVVDGDEREVAAAHALCTHHLDPPLPIGPHGEPSVPVLDHPDSLRNDQIGNGVDIGFWSANDFRLAAGTWLTAGPGAAWLRLRVPVIVGEVPTPFARLAAAADFGSGLGNAVRETTSSTINAEITVHAHRVVEGDWVGLESMSWAHAVGNGMCETRLFDTRGPVGRAVQALVVRDFNPFPSPPPSTDGATTG